MNNPIVVKKKIVEVLLKFIPNEFSEVTKKEAFKQLNEELKMENKEGDLQTSEDPGRRSTLVQKNFKRD